MIALTLRLEGDLYERLAESASQHERSINSEVIKAIEVMVGRHALEAEFNTGLDATLRDYLTNWMVAHK